MTKREIIPCPRCRKPASFLPSNPVRPFCSERCKNEDLIAWADEKYVVSIPSDETEGEDLVEEAKDDES